MSKPINLGESHELRDAAGNVVGHFVPVKEFEARYGGTNRTTITPAELDTVEEKCKRLAEECARLHAELAEVREERDAYLKSLYAMIRESPKYNKVPDFTREEVFQAVGQRPSFEELLKELEGSLGVGRV